MAGVQQPPVSKHGTEIARLIEEINSYGAPVTWAHLCRLELKIQSGSLSAGAIAGISQVNHDNPTITANKKSQEEKERITFKILEMLQEIQNELARLLKEAQDYINKLITIDPLNAGRLRILETLKDRHRDINFSIRQTTVILSDLQTKREASQTSFNQALQEGKNSPFEKQRVAAALIEERTEAGKSVITITYNLGGRELGAMPQHLVYRDERGAYYICGQKEEGTGAYSRHYIDELVLTPEERKKIEDDIKRQRDGTSRTPGGEKFGDEDAAAAERFEKANEALGREFMNGNDFLMTYDNFLAEGRRFRADIYRHERERDSLIKEQQDIETRIEKTRAEIGSTDEAREILTALESKLEEVNIRQEKLKILIEKNYDSLVTRSEEILKVSQYLVTGRYSQDSFIDNLPDEKLKQSVIDMQKARLEELERQKKALEEQKQKIVADQERSNAADAALRNITGGRSTTDAFFDRNMKRSQLMGNQTSASSLTDSDSRVVSYDPKDGKFFRKEGSKIVTYEDPVETLALFKKAWQENKIFGNESELGELTFNKHFRQISLSFDIDRQTIGLRRKNIDIKTDQIDGEMQQIHSSIQSGSGSGRAPAVATRDPNHSAASSIDPDTSRTAVTTIFAATRPVVPVAAAIDETPGPALGDVVKDQTPPPVSPTAPNTNKR